MQNRLCLLASEDFCKCKEPYRKLTRVEIAVDVSTLSVANLVYNQEMAFKRKAEPAKSGPEVAIELDKKKQVTVREFNGIKLVDIREFYVDKQSGEKKPGKKGISLTEETWKKLLELQQDINNALEDLGEGSVPPKKKVKEEEVKEDESDAE